MTEADPNDVALGATGYQATLGIAALKRLEMIVDRERGLVYMRPIAAAPLPVRT